MEHSDVSQVWMRERCYEVSPGWGRLGSVSISDAFETMTTHVAHETALFRFSSQTKKAILQPELKSFIDNTKRLIRRRTQGSVETQVRTQRSIARGRQVLERTLFPLALGSLLALSRLGL